MISAYAFGIFVIVSVCRVQSGEERDFHHLPSESQLRLRIYFKEWQLENNRQYRTYDEEEKRFSTFQTNLKLIEKLNKEHRGEALFAPNKFADMSPLEFSKTILMPRRAPPQHPDYKYIRSAVVDPLPDSFDWRDHNMVTSVKDQGSAGTCWAFSTVANVESQFGMLGQPLVNLSVEQVVDCDDSEDPAKNYADCGVYGGWPYLAFGYLKRQGGIEKWDDYNYCCGGGDNFCEVCPPGVWNSTLCGPPMPYCNMSQSCAARLSASKFVSGLTVDNWSAVDTNETVIAEQLIKLGPLSVALDARMLQFYHSGVFNPLICSKTELDHAVLLVGYGMEKSILGDTPFWTIKNSWGPKWGESGYFRIKRGIGKCGVNTQVTTAVLTKP